MKNLTKKHMIYLCLMLCFFAVFVALLILVVSKNTAQIDRFNYYVANRRNDFWNAFFKIFTNLGSFYFLMFDALILLVMCRNKKYGILALVGVCFAGGINFLIKIMVQRPRPDLMIVAENGFSFPSGHSIMSVVLFGILVYLILKFLRARFLKIGLTFVLCTLIVGICFSRIYLGVHYLTDVIAGLSLGLAILFALVVIFERINAKATGKKQEK